MYEDEVFGVTVLIFILLFFVIAILLYHLGFTVPGILLIFFFFAILGCVYTIYSINIKGIRIMFAILLLISFIFIIPLLNEPIYSTN